MALSSCVMEISTRVTLKPCCANTWAIPFPIVPAPITEMRPPEFIIWPPDLVLIMKFIKPQRGVLKFHLNRRVKKIRQMYAVQILINISFSDAMSEGLFWRKRNGEPDNYWGCLQKIN